MVISLLCILLIGLLSVVCFFVNYDLDQKIKSINDDLKEVKRVHDKLAFLLSCHVSNNDIHLEA